MRSTARSRTDEGRYVHPDPESLGAAGQVALRYRSTNPNGSMNDIAGVTDPTGLVLGLMPHPENHIVRRQHPHHRRGGGGVGTPGSASVRDRRGARQAAVSAAGAIEPLLDVDLALADRRDGKVRVSYALGGDRTGQRLFVTTDRLSAFDRIIAGVPYKGQVLNQLAAWWFEQTADIVDNHVVDIPDPHVTIARQATPLPVEVVVRGCITGVTDTALWTAYERGERTIYGHTLPDGLHKNDRLAQPIITPTTKAEAGGHDTPVTCTEVVERGLVEPALWDRVQQVALAVFERGERRGRDSGLILADTKYEFGVADDGTLLLIDEVHTPDSSRWWVAADHDERLARGEEPESLDKEVVRRALADVGFRGDGDVPELPAEVWTATTARYVDAYERLTGETFVYADYPAAPRITGAVSFLE